MKRNLERYVREREEINSLYNAPRNKRLKYAALAAIGVSIALMLAMIFLMDELSVRTMMIMRGCAGLGAIVFVVLCGVLAYRVNKEHLQERGK